MATKPQTPQPQRDNRFDYDDDAIPGIEIERATDEEHAEQKRLTTETEKAKPKP